MALGSGEFRVGPTLTGFQQKLNAGLKRIRAEKDVKLNPNFAATDAKIAAWAKTKRPEIHVKVKTDDRQLRTFHEELKRVEHTYKRSALSKAIRINISIAGAAALPALAQGALSAAAALTQLGQAALLLPGIFSGVGAAIGTLLTGFRGLGDAFSAAGKDSKTAAQDTKDYARAARDLERAQRDMRKAVRDARREIEDQGQAVRDVFLDQEQAAINVQRALEALREPSETYTDQRQKILDLNRALSDQTRVNREAIRTANDGNEVLKGGVTQTDTFRTAVDNLADATESFVESQKKANGLSSEFADAMAKLSPQAQDFVNKVRSLSGAWDNLTKAVSGRMFEGVGDAVVELANKRLPLLQTGMEKIATSFNNIFKDVLGNLGGEANAGRFTKIFDNVAAALERMRPGFDSFVDGFIHLSEVGSRFLPRLGDAFSELMGRFEAFVQRADADGSLVKWIDQGLNVISQLGSAIGSIGSILNSVTEAYQEATGNIGGFAETMAGGLGKLANYLKSAEGRKALVDYIKEAKFFLGAIKESLPGIIDAFQAFSTAAKSIAQIIFPIFARVGEFLSNNETLATGMIGAFLAWRAIVAPLLALYKRGWSTINNLSSNHLANLQRIQSAEKNVAALKGQIQGNPLTGAGGLQSGAANALIKKDLADKEYSRQAQQATKDLGSLATATSRLEKLQATAGDNGNKRRTESVKAYNDRITAANNAARILPAAEGRVVAAQERVATSSAAVTNAYNNKLSSADKAAEATGRLRTATANLNTAMVTAGGPQGGAAKMMNKIGTGVGKAATGLIGSIGGLVAGLGTTAVVGGALYAVTEWQAVNNEAADAVDRHRQAVDDLAGSLSQNTGAVTDATKKQIVDSLQNASNSVTGEKYGNVLDGQNINPDVLAEAIGSGDPAKVNEVLKGVKDRATASLKESTGLFDRISGGQFDSQTLADALAGDPTATQKYKDFTNLPGSDRLQQFLDTAGIAETTDLNDILKGLPEGTRRDFELLQSSQGLTRELNAAQAKTQQNIQGSYGNATLKPNNPFGVGADVSAGANGSATVAIPEANLTPGLLQGLESTGATRGDRRRDGKVEYTLNPDRAKLYVNFAQGGGVFGGMRGKDSVPAMLMPGEHVLTTSDVAKLGGQKGAYAFRDALANGMIPKFGTGGGVGWFPKPIVPTPGPTGLPPALSAVPAPVNPRAWGDAIFQPPSMNGPRLLPNQIPVRPAGSMTRSAFEGLKTADNTYDMGPLMSGVNSQTGLRLGDNPIFSNDLGSVLGAPGFRPGGARSGWSAPPKPLMPPTTRPPGVPVALKPPSGVPHTRPGGTSPGPGNGTPHGPGSANWPVNPSTGLPFRSTEQVQAEDRAKIEEYQRKNGIPSTLGPAPAAPLPGPAAVGAAPGPALPAGGPGVGRTGPENGLQVNTIRLKRAIEQAFPEIATIGGFRPDALKWHPDGLALDVMVGNNKELGDRVKAWVEANGAQYGFRGFETGESIWRDGGAHEDHLHLVTTGGGYPGPGGIPANSIAPVYNPATGQIEMPGGGAVTPPGLNPGGGAGGQLMGPFGPLPFQPGDIGQQIAQIFLGAIGSMFGIDLSGIMSIIQTIMGDDAVKGLFGGGAGAGAGAQQPSQYMDPYINSPAGMPSSPEGITGGVGTGSQADIARYIYQSAVGMGYTPNEAKAFVAQALGESQLSPGAYGASTGDASGGASGIFQFTPGTWASFGNGDPLDAKSNIDAYFRLAQARDPKVGDIRSRLGVNISVGGPAHPNNDPTGEKWARYWEQAGGLLGFAGGGHIRGPGGPRSDSIPAMLSNGEYVLNARAVDRIGMDRLHAMNALGFSGGGPVIDPLLMPPPAAAPSTMAGQAAQAIGIPPEAAGKALGAAGSAAGAAFAPKGGYASAGARAAYSKASDPRAALQAAPETNDHLNPAFRGAIEGGFSTVGSLAATAAQVAIGAGTMGASAAAGPAGGAAAAGIQAGFQMAGKVASGAANILSSLLVGTVTPASTGQGYGQPMLPQQMAGKQYQSIHNGNVYTNNLDEYTRTQKRMEAQKAAGMMNRF